jgi:hypothetical protein
MEVVCTLCNKNITIYTCPKCKIRYCSLNCYKIHSKDCIEIFYMEQILQNLKDNIKNSEEMKIKIIELLKKIDLKKLEEESKEENKNEELLKSKEKKVLEKLLKLNFNENNEIILDKDENMTINKEEENFENKKILIEEIKNDFDKIKNEIENNGVDNELNGVDNELNKENIEENIIIDESEDEEKKILKDFNKSLKDGRMSSWINIWT